MQVEQTPAVVQQLSPELIEAIRRGPTQAELGTDIVRVPIAGYPTLPLLEVTVNGRGPYRLLIDLGSNVTLLKKSVVADAGVDVLVRRDTSDIFRADTLEIGDAMFAGVVGGAYEDLDLDGVLGFNLLNWFPFTMDYPRMLFTFEHFELPDPKGTDVLEYVIRGRMPYVPVQIDGTELLFNLDTGAAEWFTVPKSWEQDLPWEGVPEQGPVLFNNQTGAVRVKIARLAKELRLGSHVVERPLLFVNPDADDAWIGSGFLQHFRLSFDTANQRIRIDRPQSGTLAVPPYCTPGFRLFPEEDVWHVSDVIPQTPAFHIGLRRGDHVTVIQRESGEVVDPARLARETECGVSLLVSVLRGGHEEVLAIPVAELGR